MTVNRRMLAGAAAAAVLLPLVPPVGAAAGADGSRRLPVAQSQPGLSADGTRVAFVRTTSAGMPVVVVRRVGTGHTVVASVGRHGEPVNGPSSEPALSADGRYVVFTSSASNLVVGDTNGVADVFRRDLLRAHTVRVSVGGVGSAAPSGSPSVSANGRLVAFDSEARLTATDVDDSSDVFVRDLATGRTREASPPAPVPGFDPAEVVTTGGFDPTVSADGRYVGFLAPIASEQTTWTVAVRRDLLRAAPDVACGDGDHFGFCLDPVVLASSGRALAYQNSIPAGQYGIVTYFDGRPEWTFWNDTYEIALSRDGDTVAFTTDIAVGDDVDPLYVRERTGGDPPRLVAERATDPTLSADGCRVAYVLDGLVRVGWLCTARRHVG